MKSKIWLESVIMGIEINLSGLLVFCSIEAYYLTPEYIHLLIPTVLVTIGTIRVLAIELKRGLL